MMRSKNLVITFYGPELASLAKFTHPTMRTYADRIGADFLAVPERQPDYQSLGDYERILMLDTKIVIRDDAPSLFNVVPEGWIGAYEESPGRYNAGVLLLGLGHAAWILSGGVLGRADKVFDIWAKFNRMPSFDVKANGYHRFSSYFIHYEGLDSLGSDALETLICEDLKVWESMRPDFHISRPVKVVVGGGLGDQIAAEPVVREIRRLHDKDYLIVESHWPELWKDLPYRIDQIVPPGTPTPEGCIEPVYQTYQGPDATLGFGMTHTMMSSTDLSSYLSLCRPLPPEKREIQIRATEHEDLSMLNNLLTSPYWLDSAVILHPGLTWPTRTVPERTWLEVLDGLRVRKINTVVIGQGGAYRGPNRGSDVVGIQDFPVGESDTVIDARGKLTVKETIALLSRARVLVSNDSAPIHMAGATDIWILGVFTTKHPYFVLPFRHGTPWHKAKVVNKKPECWPCGVNAIRSAPEGVRVDFCTNPEAPYGCMPSSYQILTEIREAMK